ncbi:MAG: hypothetical protein EAZ92_11455 [Candidatus Kapaibacterium sp.]|nr:MAG: hypothetical protein EAZ92_11455 [Candidatus Kapabacteria bacterium]
MRITRAEIGRRVIIDGSFSPNSCNNPQGSPILACKIGNAPEEFLPLEERFAYKNPRLGSNSWSHHFRFGYISAEAKQVVARVLWLRGADTITLMRDTVPPTFLILRPNTRYQNTLSQAQEQPYTILRSKPDEYKPLEDSVRMRFTVANITPPYSVYVPLQVKTSASLANTGVDAIGKKRGDTEIIYATTGNMEIIGTSPYIDFASSGLAVYAGNTLDTSISWKCSPSTVRLIALRPNKAGYSFDAEFEASGISLPHLDRELYSLKGALVLKFGLKVRNPYNGMVDSVPIEKKYAQISSAFVHESPSQSDEEIGREDTQTWLQKYLRAIKLPEKFAPLLSAKNLTAHILKPERGWGSKVSQRLNEEYKPFARSLFGSEDAYKSECDIWSKLEWNARLGLPKPARMIAESSSPEICEKMWQRYASFSAPRMTHFVVFLDENNSRNATSGKVLLLVPLGITPGWGNELKQASDRDLIQCALSSNNAFLSQAMTYAELQKILPKTNKRDEFGNEVYRETITEPNLALHLDSVIYKERYSASISSWRTASVDYRAFLQWCDSTRTSGSAPFSVMETDTAAMVRLREAYSSYYVSAQPDKSEALCSNTQEIKRFAAAGKEIPIYLTEEDDAEWECRSVAWQYERQYKSSNIAKVLVVFAASGERKGLPLFALTVATTRQDSSKLALPLFQQVRKPYLDRMLSVQDLQDLPCEQFDGECPVRGSMTTEYRTLYDYCTMKTRQGVFRNRASELISSRR